MRRSSYRLPRVLQANRLGRGSGHRRRSGRSQEYRTVFSEAVVASDLAVAVRMLVVADTGSCRSPGPGSCPESRSRILEVAGRCRIEKDLGSCTGHYRTAGFDRRSSRVIHRNNSLNAVRCVVHEVHERNSLALRLPPVQVVDSDESYPTQVLCGPCCAESN